MISPTFSRQAFADSLYVKDGAKAILKIEKTTGEMLDSILK